MCPYYVTDYKKCNLTDTYPSGDLKENKCLNATNWRRCANYENRSMDDKLKKRFLPTMDETEERMNRKDGPLFSGCLGRIFMCQN